MSVMSGQVVDLGRNRRPTALAAAVLIEGRGVAKTYRTREGDVETLKPLDFQIRAGEFVSVVGPSGCGKSTLMKMVAGLLPISGGSSSYRGAQSSGRRPMSESSFRARCCCRGAR